MSEQPEPPAFRAPVVAQPTGASEADEEAAARVANRFDIRRIIGGLFVLYGIVLVLVGPDAAVAGQVAVGPVDRVPQRWTTRQHPAGQAGPALHRPARCSSTSAANVASVLHTRRAVPSG